MADRKVVVVGAGLGGIAVAARLAYMGWIVEVFEKNEGPGGRCDRLVRDGFRWDTGPTLLLMPHVLAQTFAEMGERMSDYLDLVRSEPNYCIFFEDGFQIRMRSDLLAMREQIERIEPGGFEGFLQYVGQGYRLYRLAMERFVSRQFDGFWDYFGLRNLPLLFQLKALRNHYAETGRFVRDPRLRAALTFQDMYLGLSPFEAPATYALLAAAELTEGIWFPKGGMYRVVEALATIARKHGVRFYYNTPVRQIVIDQGRATGVILEEGSFVPADVVVVNADLPYAYRALLPMDPEARRLQRMRYTCSAITFYWGLDHGLPGLAAHNVFLSGDYKASLDQIFHAHALPDRPSFYLHIPSRLDPGIAPPDGEAIMVLVPVGHLEEGSAQPVDRWVEQARQAVAGRLADVLGVRDLLSRIRCEVVYTPETWRSRYNLEKGAAFGLGHQFDQVGYLRPANRHPRYHNLYFVGASTHPGTGLPMVLLSARLVAERIARDMGTRAPGRTWD